jgi:hypothetical protein
MKTLFLTLALNSFFSNDVNINDYLIHEKVEIKQNAIRAYLMRAGNFVQGTISVQQTRNGLIPINYSFQGYDRGTGQFYPDSQFVPLNPNNQYAVKHNFTHYISIPNMGTAYVIL